MEPPYASRSNAADIPVAGFKTTLLWPLTLDLTEAAASSAVDREQFVQRQAALLLNTGWTHVQDQLNHLGSGDIAGSYAELTYFHEFIQHFLFARHESQLQPATGMQAGQEHLLGKNLALPAISLFQRQDQTSLDIILQRDKETFIWFPMDVSRLNIYLLPLGVAVMALEVELSPGSQVLTGCTLDRFFPERPRRCSDEWQPRQVTLADVQRFNDQFRRAHAPFVERGEQDGLIAPPGHLPRLVIWHGTTSNRRFDVNKGDTAPATVAHGLRSRPPGSRAVPPLLHFSWLLGEGGKGWRIGPRDDVEPSWSHLADDRLPILSTVILPDCNQPDCGNYARISDGDWARLCFVDPPGNDAYPYSRAFIERDWANHVYDRFHFGEGESTDQPSRYLISGYSLIAVGYGSYFREHIAKHMRRHYFQLMLLAQIERAVLLAVSGRISLAVARYESARASGESEADIALETGLQQVEHDFLQYVHRFRFTGVSDQVQPTEIYAQLRERMRLPELYADIKDELTTATAFLALRSQQREAESAARLSIIATFGVILGLAFSFLGMNILAEPGVLSLFGLGEVKGEGTEGLQGSARVLRALAVFFGVIALSSTVGLGLAEITGSPRRGQDRLRRKLRGALSWMALGGSALALTLWGVSSLVAGSCQCP